MVIGDDEELDEKYKGGRTYTTTSCNAVWRGIRLGSRCKPRDAIFSRAAEKNYHATLMCPRVRGLLMRGIYKLEQVFRKRYDAQELGAAGCLVSSVRATLCSHPIVT